MKKLLSMLLIAILVFAFSACGSSTGGAAVSPSNAADATAGVITPDIPIDAPTQAVPTDAATAMLTREEAIEKALAAENLSRAEVRELEAELDRDRGGLYWEVEFKAGNLEYDYDIHAETGEVTRVERERD